MTSQRFRCECADRGCPTRHVSADRCNLPAHVRLFRIDMEDRAGTRFCQACADDATESGLFGDSRAGRING